MARTAAVQGTLEDLDVDKLVDDGLHDFVDQLQADLDTVHSELADAYFQPAVAGSAVAV
jgi:uncharacterized alpha-E superfamily protein